MRLLQICANVKRTPLCCSRQDEEHEGFRAITNYFIFKRIQDNVY